MKKGVSKIVSVAICFVLLGTCTLLVNAAPRICTNHRTDQVIARVRQSVTQTSSNEYHIVRYQVTYGCNNCGLAHHTKMEDQTEGHSIGSYVDLGHGDLSHSYRVTCGAYGCNATRIVTVPCNGGSSGGHAKP